MRVFDKIENCCKLKNPVVTGIIRCVDKPHYDEAVHNQIAEVQKTGTGQGAALR